MAPMVNDLSNGIVNIAIKCKNSSITTIDITN